jgi:GNAT superfamily N-acetyltransferase
MTSLTSVEDAIAELARDPLRHIVLLKHLLAYPEHAQVHRMRGPAGTATLIALEASITAYDRQAYPKAAVVALISSDHPELTASLLPHLPRDLGIVFKLSADPDLVPVSRHFPVLRRTAFVSFTSSHRSEPAPDVHVTSSPGDVAFGLFAQQGHERSWLEPLLRSGKAFACVHERNGDTVSACFAFENYGPVWEVGGVVTAPSHRRKGFGARVVSTTLAELAKRRLAPRYQVEEDNHASIQLARSVGLAPFLTITHYVHNC